MNTLFPTTLNLTLMQQTRTRGTTQPKYLPWWRVFHIWKITITSWVFYAAIKPCPCWNNPMLDNLLVTPVIFIKTGCGSVNWRCWLRAECYGRNISWDAAASCLPCCLPSLLSSHLTEPQSRPDSAAANIAICVELTGQGRGLYCQGWYQCNVRYWYLSVLFMGMK